MLLLLKNQPILQIHDNGICQILDFDRLPFGLRKENLTFMDFIEWASNRTLSIGRSYAKEILNSLRLSQTNRYEVCKACRGLSLEDCYWIKQENDEACWEEVNLFHNPLSLFVTEISLSGQNMHFPMNMKSCKTNRHDTNQHWNIHTPELTTMGASAKGWIRKNGDLYLHKVGKYEICADQILDALQISHISYSISTEEETDAYLSPERKEWLQGVGECIVNSKLFTSEETALVTFEEFSLFCCYYGLNPYEEAMKLDRRLYLQMQIADYLLNNNDRHEQNWGFLMDNASGKITGFCPLFDHDHAFSNYENVMSQTSKEPMTLFEAAKNAQAELEMDLQPLLQMERPTLLTDRQWELVGERTQQMIIE